MPLYDYQCSKCHEVTEVRHGFDDTHSEPCPKCGADLKRLFNPAGIVFKGSGFYINDSRKSSEPKSESSSETKSETKSESKPAEAKSASATSKESAA
ncbi:MAG: hypothetical protein NVSMB31_11970 [Vulcanimicrobiaceae bacterium]